MEKIIRKKILNTVIALGILVILFFIAYQSVLSTKTVADWLKSWEASMANAEEFKKIESSEKVVFDTDTIDIKAQKDEQILKIRVMNGVDKKTTEKYIGYMRSNIEALFYPYEVPAMYVGIVENFTYPEEIKPIANETKIMGQNVTYYIAYANQKLSYAVYDWDQAKYRGILAWIYCEEGKRLFQIEIFTPVKQFSLEESLNMIQTFRCY